MNSNTVVRAYRELEHEGIVELRHGLGAFIANSVEKHGKWMRKAQAVVQSAVVDRLREIRRLFENELSAMQAGSLEEKR